VAGMSGACEESLARLKLSAADVDLVVPHQANLRIIEAVARRTQVPMDKVFVNIRRYGNMSAATVAIALCEAVEEGRVRPGALLLLPGFGGGLSYSAHVVRWGARTQALASSAVALPPNERSALELIQDCLRRKTTPADSNAADPFAGL
jgi:3-oxoacyl-[acyl-carrier-protein] synthase III